MDYRFSKSISLSDAIGKFAKENQLDKKLESLRVAELFVSSLPESARRLVTRVDFSNGILRAQVESASLRQNLQMASASLCDIINEKLDATIVRKIMLS